MNHQATSISLSRPTGCTWTDLSKTAQTWTGILNGLAAFCFALTVSWNHQTWSADLLVPLVVCVFGGLVMAWSVAARSWRISLIFSTVTAIVLLIVGGIALHIPTGMAVATLFAGIASAALCLPHVLQGEVAAGCIINLRIFTGLAVANVLVEWFSQLSAQSTQSPSTVLFTVVISIGLLFGEVALARHVEAKSTGLAQKATLYTGAGIMTLTVLIAGLGPIVAGIAGLIIFGILAFVISPVISPLLQQLLRWLHGKSSTHHTTNQTQSIHNSATQHMPPAPATSSALHWIVWAILVALMLAVVLVYLLTRRQKEAASTDKQAQTPMETKTIVRRDKHIDSFLLERTDQPTRLAMQKRLKVWHQKGHTIGRAETVRELLARLPDTERTNADIELTQAYERARYGLWRQARPPGTYSDLDNGNTDKKD